VVIDKLSTQIQSASGSIKLIEEELNIKFRGLDAAKQGQLEARERLLTEMEESARNRAEAAESEGYRLKGLLVHMEHVLGTMRSQTAEEKERLRQEHQRLEAMQMALEADRISLHKRSSDEMALVKQRQREVHLLHLSACR
jgi:FtsZ-binding cell division protein ZapB